MVQRFGRLCVSCNSIAEIGGWEVREMCLELPEAALPLVSAGKEMKAWFEMKLGYASVLFSTED